MKKNSTNLGRLTTAILLFLTSYLSANITTNEDAMWGLTCPPNVTVNCDAELWDLSIYGDATYHNHTGYRSAGIPVVTKNMGSCGTGTIQRKWTIEDNYWNLHSCTQTITIGGGTFNGSSIQWPAMVTLEGCDPNTDPSITGKPSWFSTGCSKIGTSYKDAVYTVSPDCKKILRQWTVMDWCNMSSYHNQWTYTQAIIIVVNTPPAVKCLNDITVSAFDCDKGKVESGILTVDPSSCGGNYEVTNDSKFATSNKNNLAGIYPIGTTKVTFTIKYGCGQKTTCVTNVTVKNEMAPVPICNNHLSVALMGLDTDKDGINDQGMAELWAKDLDIKSYSPCNNLPLRFSFAKDSNVMNRTFTCDDLGKNKVRVYVVDSKGGQSFCEVDINIQNNGANIKDCKRKEIVAPQNRFLVNGSVKTQFNKAVRDVDFELINQSELYTYKVIFDTIKTIKNDSFKNYSGYWMWYTHEKMEVTSRKDSVINPLAIMKSSSNENGTFAYDTVMQFGKTYMLKAMPYNGLMTNIDSADLEVLTKHLSGENIIESATQKMAADLDRNNTIDQNDLALMNKYLSGEITSFGQNWILMKEGKIDAVTEFAEVKKDHKEVNFTAIQLGDITETKALIRPDYKIQVAENRQKNLADNLEINAYPNPFREVFNLSVKSNIDTKAIIALHNTSGQLVYKNEVQLTKGQNEIRLELENISTGLYLYSVTTSEGKLAGKIQNID
jgi:hypothetical protein